MIAAKVLYVTSTLPCPPIQGSHQRVLNIGRQMKKYANVQMAYVGSQPDSRRLEETQKVFGPVELFITHQMNLPQWMQSHRHRFKFHWPWYHSDKVSKTDERRFHDLRNKFDLIWFHTVAPADAFRQRCFSKSVMDLDDLNHIKFALMHRTETSIRDKIATKILFYKWHRWEFKARRRFSIITVCSQNDKNILSNSAPVFVIPNGYKCPRHEPLYLQRTGNRLGFLGLLDYTPNARGLQWFAEEIWPIIQDKIPDAQLRVMGPESRRLDVSVFRGFKVLGFVEDSATEMATWSALVVPLRFGGGTRLKILDAFSKKCPVISTSVGAYGLKAENKKHLVIADAPDQFAQECIKLMKNSQTGRQLAENAWELFKREYDWDKIGSNIEAILAKANDL